jgi:hypothetical protein
MNYYDDIQYINIPLIIISENDSLSDMIKNGELHELINKWKTCNKQEQPIYKISYHEIRYLNSYYDDSIDNNIIYTYDEKDKVYIFSFNGELIAITTDKVVMDKELKRITKLLGDL